MNQVYLISQGQANNRAISRGVDIIRNYQTLHVVYRPLTLLQNLKGEAAWGPDRKIFSENLSHRKVSTKIRFPSIHLKPSIRLNLPSPSEMRNSLFQSVIITLPSCPNKHILQNKRQVSVCSKVAFSKLFEYLRSKKGRKVIINGIV